VTAPERCARCPRCHHLQERKSKLARVLCSGCGLTYYRFKPETATLPRLRPAEEGGVVSEPPAPPKCEECIRLTVTGHGTFPYAGGHTLNLHAEIAELRAQRELLAGQLAIDSEWGCDRWVEWAVAVLTPKEGSP
jgi:hypothetical protein